MKAISKFLFHALLTLVIIGPLVVLVIWSIAGQWPMDSLFPTTFTTRGIEQVMRLNSQFIELIVSNVLLSSTVSLISVVSGLCTAKVMNKASKSVERVVLFTINLPYLVPATVFSMGIHVHMIRAGVNNSWVGVMLVHVIYSLPYATILIMNGYRNYGSELEEQAMLLGANAWQVLTKVTLPILSPVLLIAFIMSFIISFSQYFLTLILGGGQVATLTTLIFPYLQNNDRTIASIYGLLFLLVTLGVCLIFMGIHKLYQKWQTSY